MERDNEIEYVICISRGILIYRETYDETDS